MKYLLFILPLILLSEVSNGQQIGEKKFAFGPHLGMFSEKYFTKGQTDSISINSKGGGFGNMFFGFFGEYQLNTNFPHKMSQSRI